MMSTSLKTVCGFEKQALDSHEQTSNILYTSIDKSVSLPDPRRRGFVRENLELDSYHSLGEISIV